MMLFSVSTKIIILISLSRKFLCIQHETYSYQSTFDKRSRLSHISHLLILTPLLSPVRSHLQNTCECECVCEHMTLTV